MRTLQQAASRAVGLWRVSCDLCGKHIVGSGLYFSEASKGLEPPAVWTLCATCSALVTHHMEKIRGDAPMRLRIAVGVAASELGVTKPAASMDRMSEEIGFNRLLVAVVWLAFIVHAAAFILVVAVIAASH